MYNLKDLENLSALKISLASPEKIRSWSYGEITKPETINYRTFRPERDGLFDERIFGPVQDYNCSCGKYKGIRYKGIICDKCGVEITASRVRRERMGHIELASPVAHVWFFKGVPNRISSILDIAPKNLEAVIYFSSFIILELDHDKKAEVISAIEENIKKIPDQVREDHKLNEVELKKELDGLLALIPATDVKKDKKISELNNKYAKKIQKMQSRFDLDVIKAEKKLIRTKKKIEIMEEKSVMTDSEFYSLQEQIESFAKVGIGAEAIFELLKNIDLTALAQTLRTKVTELKGQSANKVLKRIRIVEGFRRSKIDPSWMIFNVIPVVPSETRPMVQLDGGRFATSDLNDLYRRLINRNNRLKNLMSIGAPDIITRNEKRMLQEAVDALIDSGKSRKVSRISRGAKTLKSLAEVIKGKQGRFRQNLLGKRVDFSARAVIVAGPELNLNECGIPKKIALELYKPFVLKEILLRGMAPNIKTARIMVEDEEEAVFDVLEEVVKDRPVLLNRAPTLHRLGIQGFYPKLIEGNAIKLHPLVCVGYNADFDGDQMAVHLPITDEAITEINNGLMASHNLLKPSAGEFIALATRDMYFGTYYLSRMSNDKPRFDRHFTIDEAITAHLQETLNINEPLNVVLESGEKVVTSVGRLMLNSTFPKDYPYISKLIDRTVFKELAIDIHKKYGNDVVANFLDKMKNLGFKYSTVSGISAAITDVVMVKERPEIIAQAEKKIVEIESNLYKGLITKEEFKSLSHQIWIEATDVLDLKTWEALTEDNPLKIMILTGAGKASRAQIKQVGGMKGLVQDPKGNLVDLPVRSNYRIGLTGFESFNSSRGTRKGLTDKGLKTADAGYLTRRLVDVSQDLIINNDDCGSTEGKLITINDKTSLADFYARIRGRFLSSDVIEPSTKNVIAKRNDFIDDNMLKLFQEKHVEEIEVRSPLYCETRHGICKKCYGSDLTTLYEIKEGIAVGVVAAQAIGEPGTQLTMKTFHSGGIAGKDITMGLPRVEEIFEARNPRNLAIICEISGKVKITEFKDGSKELKVTAIDKTSEIPEVVYKVDPVSEVIVKDGALVSIGDALTLGHLNLNELFSLKGIKETEKYIIDQVQKVYSSQGVLLDDKHIEMIVRRMFDKVEILESGDTDLLSKEIVTKDSFEEINEKTIAEGGTPAKAKIILLGISKSALNTDSFLSAASFQETVRVLSEAASVGAIDKLRGLKESVITGKIIPVGTGYKKLEIKTE